VLRLVGLQCVTDEEVIDSHFHMDRACKKLEMFTLDWDVAHTRQEGPKTKYSGDELLRPGKVSIEGRS